MMYIQYIQIISITISYHNIQSSLDTNKAKRKQVLATTY